MRLSHQNTSSLDEAVRPMVNIGGISDKMVDSAILKAECIIFPNTQVIVCCTTLKNGMHVITSAECRDNSFDPQKGQDLAVEKARKKVRKHLEFYSRQSKLMPETTAPLPPGIPPEAYRPQSMTDKMRDSISMMNQSPPNQEKYYG